MTTRRRRAGSETIVEELLTPDIAATTQNNLQGPSLLPVSSSSSILPQWGAPLLVNASTDQAAYYKKTDTFSSVPPGAPGLTGAQPKFGNPLWQVNAPSWNQVQTYNPNNNYYDANNIYGSGTVSVAHETNYQWYNNKGDISYQQDYSNSSNNWNTGNLQPGASHLSNIDDSVMASRDRTQEFMRIVRSQQGSQTNGVLPHQDGKRPRDLRQYKEFMQRSKLIGRNISSTYAKLEKLTHLAKKRSLFDDSHDQEVQELTGIIRHDLTSLTKQLADLRGQSRIASPNGTGAHLQKHSSNLVGSLQTKVAFITQKFKDVLEVRTENLKKQAERRDHFTGGRVSGELPQGAVAGHHQGSVLIADEAAAYNTNMGGDIPRSNGDVAINLGGGGAYHQQLQLMEEQDTYLQSRADTMKTIESTIVELGQMFTQLATMVKEQEELVHRIDANVEDAELNVEAAHSELLKYFKSVSSNRMLMVKVFGIMIVFFIVFVVFMA